MIIDAHVHLWNPARGDYGWMPPDDPVLARPYAPADLAPLLAEHGVDRVVLVQAAPTVEETEYMLGLADATPWVAGVVGWVDFEREGARRDLERLARHPKFVGVRPMIQDIDDVDWMLRADVQWAYAALVDLGLCFDALGFPRHLANFDALMARHPRLRVMVDHCMKPRVGDRAGFAAWAGGIARLADRGAFCKLSGLVTEAEADWEAGSLAPYVDRVLEAFGPKRIAWGSDWPVCRLRAEYGVWRAAALALTERLAEGDRAAVFGGTATRFYRLGA